MELSDSITDVKQITPEELTKRLVQNGFIRSGQVISVEKTDSFGSTAAKWDRLTIVFSDDYDGDVPNKLALKVYRKGWFGGGVIEWTFYNELASSTPGVSVCPVYDGGIDHENRDCHFLLADLSETHVDHPPKEGLQPYEAVVEELLKYHIHWWNDSQLKEWPFYNRHGGPLRMAQAIAEEDVRESCRDFKKDLDNFVKKSGDELEPFWIETTEKVIEKYPDAFLARVLDSPNITLLHGDAHLWNLFYPKDPETDKLILSDWETYKRGLGVYDLAYLLVHGTSGRRKLEHGLMDFYYRGLIDGGISHYSREDFEYDFRLSVISCVFCPLIWKRVFSMCSAVEAYVDWNCAEILDSFI